MCVCVLQLVRECKEVLKGGLLMKQYYQFMLRGVVTDPQGVQTNANIDEFEEDLQKMLLVLQHSLLYNPQHHSMSACTFSDLFIS